MPLIIREAMLPLARLIVDVDSSFNQIDWPNNPLHGRNLKLMMM